MNVPPIDFVFLANNRSSRKNQFGAHLRFRFIKFYIMTALRVMCTFRQE